MYEKLSYSNSDELCEQMAAECDTCILAFSLGKDSVASWLQLRKYFKRIIPIYKYAIPKLEFVEDNLKYYEDFFGTHIYRFPHPTVYQMLNAGVAQTPETWRIITENRPFPSRKDYNDSSPSKIMRELEGLPDSVYTAVGIRASDSPIRRMNVKVHGAVVHNKQTFYPIYDWLKGRLLKEFDDAGIKLSSDYQLWNNSFDGVSYKYLVEIRKHYPRDYERIKRLFPMADLEFLRRGEE